MGLISVLKFITHHPLNRRNKAAAVWRFAVWQVRTRLSAGPYTHRFTEKAILIVTRGMFGATGNIYCGLHEFSDMGFLLHFLRPGDLFADIGANVGSYTVLASAHVGARTICAEPVPATFANLTRNIVANNMADRVTALNMAIGADKGFVEFTSTLDTVNHVATENDTNKIKVEMDSLDNILAGKAVPALLKIDVEGFETEVINGAKNTLADHQLKAIIIELNGSGKRYGYDETKIHDTFLKAGFSPFIYDPLTRSLTPAAGIGFHNTIYLRDLDFVQNRIKEATQFVILGNSL